jgi:peptidoglycan hydrolase-like protein with peptidoglycan-binding domain
MTPRLARIALAAFAVVAGGATYNALWLQEGAAVDRKAAADQARSGKPGPSQAKAAVDRASADTIRAIQRELKQRGYGPLAADGTMRPVTRAAIMAFEHENRLPLRGEATEDLLKHLVLGAPSLAQTAVASKVQSPHAEAVVRQVQRLLTERGYRPGPADGRLSAETVAAIRLFERDQGLAPKGRISAEVFSRLQEHAGGPTVHAER